MFSAKPICFGQKPKADGVPKPHMRGPSANIRKAALAEAGDILDQLPGPGESLHAIMTGRYDLTDLLEVIFAKLGPVEHLRIATLSFNQHNLNLMGEWTRAGTVKRLTLLYSLFFREHNPEIVHEMARLIPEARTAASRNHCKVVTLDFANGRKLSLEGSANLRTNSNQENFCLIDSNDLHAFHANWIDEQVAKHEAK